MNRHKIKLITNILSFILTMLCIFCGLICVIVYINTDLLLIYQTALAMLVPILQYIFRAIKNTFIFILLHLSLIIGCIYIILNSNLMLMQTVLYGFFWTISLIVFIYDIFAEKNMAIKSRSSAPIVFMLIFLAISSPKAELIHIRMLGVIIILSTILYLILFFITNMFTFYEGNVTSGVLNYTKTMKYSTKIISGFLGVSLMTMSALVFLPSTGLLDKIKHFLFLIVRFIFRLLLQKPSDVVKVTPTPEPTKSLPPIDETGILEPTKEPLIDPEIFDTGLKILTVIGVIAFIFMVLYGIYSAIKNRTFFKDNEERSFVSPFESDQNIEKKDSSSKKEGLLSKLKFLNPNAKTRRLFKKTITLNASLGERIQSYYTPSQLCEITSIESEKAELDEMRHLYEKARYSSEGCSKADAKRAEQLSKIINSK